MPRTRTPFAVQSYEGRSKPLTVQRLVNLYAEQAPQDAKSKVIAYGTPGLASFVSGLSDLIRGACVQDNTAYVVAGDTLTSITSNGTTTTISGAIPGTGIVKLVPGRTNIAILRDNGDLYAYDGSSVSKVTDTDLPTVSDAAYQDGYLIVSQAENDRFYVSSLFDFGTWDALDFATAESQGDKLVSVISDRRELFLFGLRTTEVWYNTGDTFPFQRREVIQRGCRARDSVVNFDNSLIWLGDDGVIYRMAGYSPQRISTHAVEHAIETDTFHGQQAQAFQYSQEGHKFYCLKLDNETWVYDAATNFWHERQSYEEANWRVEGTVEAFGKVLAWDDTRAKLYMLDLDTYTEDGETIRRIAQTPPITAERRRAFMPRFELEAEMGVGLTTGQGSDPQAMLRYSDDGGRTWSAQLWRSMGAIGEYTRRAVWHRLGSFRQRTMQIVVSDPVRVAITAMVADIEVGSN